MKNPFLKIGLKRSLKISCYLAIFLAIALAKPISAHKVEVAEDVGATLHIEPNDNPKAGEPTKIWFALTKIGGTIIPLSKCDCKLVIYDQMRSPISDQNPVLKPLSAEGYQNIPSAEVTFPKIGRYNLEISGQPQDGEDFTPFKLNFTVTVATAISEIKSPDADAKITNPIPKVTTEQSPNQLNSIIPLTIGIGIISISGVILVFKNKMGDRN